MLYISSPYNTQPEYHLNLIERINELIGENIERYNSYRGSNLIEETNQGRMHILSEYIENEDPGLEKYRVLGSCSSGLQVVVCVEFMPGEDYERSIDLIKDKPIFEKTNQLEDALEEYDIVYLTMSNKIYEYSLLDI